MKNKDEFAESLLKEIKDAIVPEFGSFPKYFSALESPSKYYDFNEKEGYSFKKEIIKHNGRLYDYYILTIPIENPFYYEKISKKENGFIPRNVYISYIFYKDRKDPNVPPAALRDGYIFGTYGGDENITEKVNLDYFMKFYTEESQKKSVLESVKSFLKNVFPDNSEKRFLKELKEKTIKADEKAEEIIHSLGGVFFKNFLNPNDENDYGNVSLAAVTEGKRKEYIQSLNFLNGYGYYKYIKKDVYRAKYMAMKYIEWIYLDIGENTYLKGFNEHAKILRPLGVKDSLFAFTKTFADILFDARLVRDVSYGLYNAYFSKVYEMNKEGMIKDSELKNVLKKLMYPLKKSAERIKNKNVMVSNMYLSEENVLKLYEKAESLFSPQEINEYTNEYFKIPVSSKKEFKEFVSDRKKFLKYLAEFSASEKSYIPPDKKLTGPGKFIPADKGPLTDYLKYTEYASLITSKKAIEKERMKNVKERRI